MKVKRIQRRHPLEKNRIKRLIRGTRLEVKKPKKLHKTKRRSTDPDKYITVKPVEVDAVDIRGRSTLIVHPLFAFFSLPFLSISLSISSPSFPRLRQLTLSSCGGTCPYLLDAGICSDPSTPICGRAALFAN